GDPIFVFCNECDTWVVDFALAHFVGPIVYIDPPFTAIWSAQVPLVTSVHTFCLCRLETAAHGIEHPLRRRIFGTGRRSHCCTHANHRGNPADPNKEGSLLFQLPVHSSFVCDSSFIILLASLLNSPQKKRGAQECDHRAG